MSADDRRASILDAAVPLLLERGAGVSTRELAAAAGVAEGTLFRVFPDKKALVHAAIGRLVDPAPVLAELDSLASAIRDEPLRAALVRVVALLQSRAQAISSVMIVAHQVLAEDAGGPREKGVHGMHGAGYRGRAAGDAIAGAIAPLLVPHAAELRLPPTDCVRFLTALVFATVRPGVATSAAPLSPEEIVDVLLDGLRSRPEEI